MIMPGFICGFILAGTMSFEDGFSLKRLLLFLLGAPLLSVIAGFLFIPAGLVYLIWSATRIDCEETGTGAKQ